jgi:hypothetical protein
MGKVLPALPKSICCQSDRLIFGRSVPSRIRLVWQYPRVLEPVFLKTFHKLYENAPPGTMERYYKLHVNKSNTTLS